MAHVVAALMFPLAGGAAQAQTVNFDPNDPTMAIGIDDLVVDGTTYDVDFSEKTNPQAVYGDFPGVLDFDDQASAEAAVDAVDLALNGAAGPPFLVGAEGSSGDDKYIIGFDTDSVGASRLLLHVGGFRDVADWQRTPEQDSTLWFALPPTTRVIATFTPSGATPPVIDFSADPEVIEFGASSTLSWSVQNATSCTGSMGSGGWAGDKDPVSGSEEVSPMVTSTYVLTCGGAGGQSEEDVTVTVPEPHATLAMLAALASLGAVGRMRRRP